MPVLFVLDAQGGKTPVNYSLVGGDTYVTDRLFDRAVLVAGVEERSGGFASSGRVKPADERRFLLRPLERRS
ncbi:MAG: TrbG/VirB9 family P-type conjugative transfer protein [Gemmatimonadota bacterium]|nr:TrbG/VirB9 family P-type conjugative transfer protein [Gemmatimonadota bacterium]